MNTKKRIVRNIWLIRVLWAAIVALCWHWLLEAFWHFQIDVFDPAGFIAWLTVTIMTVGELALFLECKAPEPLRIPWRKIGMALGRTPRNRRKPDGWRAAVSAIFS